MYELKFGLTGQAGCSYLPQQQEQLVFLLPGQPLDAALYQQLMQLNFRRSGEQVYTPHCPSCRSCQSVRIAATQFSASRHQRRIWVKAQRENWQFSLKAAASTDYFPLFAAYINHKHSNGSMYPADRSQLEGMLQCSWLKVLVLEQYYQQKLVAVTIVDETADALSAVYTFFDPDVSRYSPGILAIMQLLQNSAAANKQWLYLGYQIDDCQKMAYKAAFLPQQRFIQGQWHSFG